MNSLSKKVDNSNAPPSIVIVGHKIFQREGYEKTSSTVFPSALAMRIAPEISGCR